MQWAGKFDDFNQRVQAQGNADPDFIFVDVKTPLLSKSGRPDSSLFRKDMLHLNDEGYKRWEKVVKPALKEAFP